MYVVPKEAAKILGVSVATITRCKALGAPVRYKGTCGRLYVLDPDVWIDWMNERGQAAEKKKIKPVDMYELRAARHRAI